MEQQTTRAGTGAGTPKRAVSLRVNGDDYEVACAANTTLLDALREKALLTGTKRGCDLGACGACTVIMDGEAVLSCLTLAFEAEGRDIRTVEGLAVGGELSALQRAFVDYGAIQCGFCSPGFLMSATALLEEDPHPSRADIKRKLAGNLCRCTGYAKILEAVEAVAAGDGAGSDGGAGASAGDRSETAGSVR